LHWQIFRKNPNEKGRRKIRHPFHFAQKVSCRIPQDQTE
jgi:hypothetical protein